MGYACPVCDDPQADAGHLANHLAFTALARGGDHEEWLDDHVPDWGEYDEGRLADEVAPLADEREFPQLFEDTAGGLEGSTDLDHGEGGHDHGEGGHGRGHDSSPTHPAAVDPGRFGDGDAELDDEAREILEEARDLTERRHDAADEPPADEDSETE